MAYTYNKPDATDTISSSQSVLKDNFTAIKQLVDVNHATFGDPSEGKHNIVHFPQLTTGASIPAATSATEYALYNRAISGVPGLFIRIPGQSAGATTGDISLTSSAGLTAQGSTQLPSGLIVKWGSSNGRDNVTVTYDTTFPFTTVFSIMVTTTLIPAGGGVTALQRADTLARWYQPLGPLPTTTFNVICTKLDGVTLTLPAVDVFFNYIAIGV